MKRVKNKPNKKLYPHFENCRCGNGGERLRKDNPWWLKAPKYHNCFWVYLRHNTRPHTLKEIADLHGKSISAITVIESKAIKNLKKEVAKLNLSIYKTTDNK